MVLPLSGVSSDDEVSIQSLSLWSSFLRAPFSRSSRQLLAHIVCNHLPAWQKPRMIGGLSSLVDGDCPLHSVCLDCAAIFASSRLLKGSRLRAVPRSENYLLHDDLRHFEVAVRSGCHFCSLLWENFKNLPPDPEARVYVQLTKRHGCETEIYVTVAPLLGLYPRGLLPRYSGTKFETSPSPGWFRAGGASSHPHPAQWSTYTGSHQHSLLAKYWISECAQKHQECRRQRAERLIPARYISIDNAENGELKLNLHITSEEDRSVQYCALSHCWGGATDILTLNSVNIEDLKGHIDIKTLAQSFQDAITLTKALGMKFVWIDCLCIIQNSKKDWLQESARMGHTYENATCTIMAAAARNPHGGLFHQRDPLTYSPFLIAGSLSNGLFILPPGKKGKMEEVLDEAHLQSRAWTFQESYLSPRKLYFGPNGIYWSCFTGEATERDPDGKERIKPNAPKTDKSATIFGPSHVEVSKIPGIPPLVLDNDLVLTVARGVVGSAPYLPSNTEHVITGNISMQHGKSPRRAPTIVDNVQYWAGQRSQEHESLADFHANWFDLVAVYSGRSLTKPSDKLIAISGIANRIADDCGYQYVAGLWKETILLDLLWHVDPHSNPGLLEDRVPDYVAPSWSWASTKGIAASSFLQPELVSVALVQVKSVTVSAGDLDMGPTGLVSNGVLKVVGRLRQVSDVKFTEHERAGTSHRRADVYHGEREMGWVDYDIAPPSDDLPTFICPVVQDIDWSFSHYPRIWGIAMVYRETYFERVGAFRSRSQLKAKAEEDYEWFHEGDAFEFEIR